MRPVILLFWILSTACCSPLLKHPAQKLEEAHKENVHPSDSTETSLALSSTTSKIANKEELQERGFWKTVTNPLGAVEDLAGKVIDGLLSSSNIVYDLLRNIAESILEVALKVNKVFPGLKKELKESEGGELFFFLIRLILKMGAATIAGANGFLSRVFKVFFDVWKVVESWVFKLIRWLFPNFIKKLIHLAKNVFFWLLRMVISKGLSFVTMGIL